MSDIEINVKDELKTVGTYKTISYGRAGAAGAPKYNTPVTPKENLFRFIKGEGLWSPCTSDIVTLCPAIIPDNVARGFVIDTNGIDNSTEAGGKDMFGVEWEWIPQVGGSMVRPGNPLLVPDITEWEKYVKFPDLDDYDWEGSVKANAELLNDGRAVMLWCMNGLFERLISFMEFENAALALVDEDEQEGVHRLFDKLCNFYDDLFDRYKKYYNCDLVYFHDDWGSQRAPFFSADTVREMLLPYLKRVCDSAHKRGMLIDFHSCGKIEMLVPLMIEAGVDIWSGQPMNDRVQVLKDHGGKIKLNFGPSVFTPGQPPSEEIVVKGVNEFLGTYGDYISSIVVAAYGGPKVYEMIYEFSRKAMAK